MIRVICKKRVSHPAPQSHPCLRRGMGHLWWNFAQSSISIMILVVLISGNVFAQKTKKLSFSLSAGPAILTSPFLWEDIYATGFNVKLRVSHPFNKSLNTIFDISYLRFPGENAESDDSDSPRSDPLSIVGFTMGLKLSLSVNEATTPYLIQAVGFNMINRPKVYTGDDVFLSSDEGTPFSVFFGGGVDITLTPKLSLYAEAVYSIAFLHEDNVEYLPFRVGINFKRG
jgi:hypothetical protein